MWNSSVPGHGAGGVRYDVLGAGQYLGGVSRKDQKKDDVDTHKDKETVTQLLKELDDAEKMFKSQTAQDLRDKLNERRKALGDEKFKAILEQLKKEASEDWLAFLKRLFPDLFPDEQSSTPSPPIGKGSGNGSGSGSGSVSGSGNGNGSGGFDRGGFGSVESMSNKPFTAGAHYSNYKLDKSNPGTKPGMGNEAGNIWSGFSQGPDGNCTTVAAIKAAMMKFGNKPTDVFMDVQPKGDGFSVKMRDGFELDLSKAELVQAAQQARFQGTDAEMITNANFMYAASAKRAHMEGNEGYGYGSDHNAKNSYQDALVSLNDGERPDEALNRLGLKNMYRKSSSDELASGALGVVAYKEHTMAVIGGHTELWGGRGGRPEREDWYWGGAYAFK